MGMRKFDRVTVMGATEQESRINGTRSDMLKKVTPGKDVNIVAACPNKAVTGSCPNEKCLYELGACF
jgi:hypothetical protein